MFAGSGFKRDRLAILTDECSKSPEEALAFAKEYGLKWIELRDVPGVRKAYFRQSDAELKAALASFKEAGMKVSFLNTPFFKQRLPGTEPIVRGNVSPDALKMRYERAQKEFDNRWTDLEQACRAAHLLEVDRIRVFGFARVQDPSTVYQQVADVLGEVAEKASKEGIKVLIENEASCNVGTTAELVAVTKLLPAKTVGMNWDPGNAVFLGEKGYPDGYKMLPMARLDNVQIKGKGLLDEKEFVDWASILPQLVKDGYRGRAGLETHYFDGTVIEKSHLSMKKLFDMTVA